MADVKCPSCGKTNPKELEICQFCGALLRQARTEPLDPILPGQFPEKKATSDLERTLPGWLRDARRAGNEPNTSPIPQIKIPQDTPPPAPQKPSDAPFDLLAGLSQAGKDEEEVPDWLKNLQGETPPASAPAAPQETPGWLEDLQEQPAETKQAPQPEAWGFSSEAANFNFDESLETVQSFGDTPDWLTALERQESAAQQPQPPAEEFPSLPGDTPDWLSSLGSAGAAQPESAPVEPAPPGSAETPDWLSSLGGFEPPSQPQPEPAPPSPGDDLPNWLADLQSPAQPPVNASQDVPATGAPAAEIPASDLPDWMMSSPQEFAPSNTLEAIETPSAETPAAEISTGDLPDWMSGLQEGASTETSADEIPAEIPTSGLPDWMSGLQEPAARSDSPLPPSPSDLPDWLTSVMDEQPAQPAAPSTETAPPRPSKPFPTGALDEFKTLAENEPLPDFLSGLAPDETEKKPEPEPESGALPGWLAGMAAGAAAASIETEAALPVEAGKPVEAESPAVAEAQNLSPAQEGIDSLLLDVPDWLAGFTPSVEAEQPAESAAPEDADLRPVELPSWVQAMRPVESMLAGTESVNLEDGEVEQQGPLAGFRSVLPVPAEAFEIRKPRAYALKLQVGESQRAQAALLEKLLASETESKAAVPPKELSLLRPLRWILFAILTLAVLLPAILGTRAFPAPRLPANASAPFNQFYDTLANTASDSAPVLVVTDYQPGFAGEMEQAAAPVITHLMRKNSRVAFLSTSPVSVEMGERLLQKALAFYKKNGQDAPSYLLGEQYLFLGYLPGGAAGVKAFAEQPRKMTGVDSLSGDLWQTDMLRNKIADISGFAAVIVITDDPDNGRLWIEQTGARLGDTPMLMVASAQAGPMLQPYAVSGQLSGLVVGLEGGALYETRDAQPGSVYPGHIKALYWDGFGAALIVALLAIFIGALWGLVERFRARKEAAEQDEA